jgi:(1->4)-alpha-D-glucan 1-alpha-D-glucosylmutase
LAPSSFPLATYRIQLSRQLRFKEVQELVEYFHELGISHLYTSPILKAKSGSTHGYDVTDYSQLNPEIGTTQEFEDLVKVLHSKSLGILLDIVPNHMYIGNNENPWWNSILEKGQKSPFADFFDIDWHPPRHIFDNKVFLSLLDRVFGKALENQTLKVSYDKGRFVLYVGDLSLPTDPESWHLILEPLCHEVEKLLSERDKDVMELKEILRELNTPHIDRRIQALFEHQPIIQERLMKQLETFNGTKSNPLSFDLLEAFLNVQHYRLCYWRVANDEINYRRFFDIFEFASIRIENEKTFKAVHKLIFEFLKKGWINGLRIDHIDGLWDPQKYLEDLAQNSGDVSTYVIAEKILTGNEKLRQEWSLNGSVGYDFLNQVNGLFVYQLHKQKLTDIYQKFTGHQENIGDLKYRCKKFILNSSLASELHLLTLRLSGVAEKHRYFQDFTFESLKTALSEIIACFPVYRTYTQAIGVIHEDDRKAISAAVARACRLNCIIDRSVYAFIEDILFFKYPDGVETAYKAACTDFVMHFQQVTSPVMAKGLEDTASYRYFPLSSLNEVGGDLWTFGINKDNFHKKNLERFDNWPHSMLATTTHDTKRSEDVRARINLLSEIPDQWDAVLYTWSQLNQKYKVKIDEESVPDSNEEYLLYQTLLGTWPFNGIDEVYVKRVQSYMEKAIKEAKVNNSWINPNESYDEAVKLFIQKVCEDRQFLESFAPFSSKIAEWGMLNSLSQLVLKLTSPGIPDIYQGNELWDFSLVDPDNRHPIDFSANKQKINHLKNLEDCLKTPQDGRIKLFVTQKILQLRQRSPEVFAEGRYLILDVQGPKEEHVIAYARVFGTQAVLVLTSRFFTFFMKGFHDRKDFWSDDMFIKLPDELAKFEFRDIFTQRVFPKNERMNLKAIFSEIPFAVLESL